MEQQQLVLREFRRCTRCQQVKPASEFHRDKTKPSGYVSHCKDCIREYQRRNQDKFRASRRRYVKRLAQRSPETVYDQDESVATKRCSTCGNIKTLSGFEKDITKPNGYRYQCKSCHNEHKRRWYRKNADRIRERSRRRCREQAAQRRRERLEYLSTHTRLCRFCHQKKPLLEFHRDNNHCKTCGDAVNATAGATLLRGENRQIIRRYRKMLNRKRRLYPSDTARDDQRLIVGDCTEEQLRQRCEYYGWRCYLCNQELDEDNVSIDHRIPMSRGGPCYPANLAPVCLECNLSKGDKTTLEYVKWIIFVERCHAD